MPELPDLVHVEARLRATIVGRVVTSARMGDPVALRMMVTDPFPGVLVGRAIDGVERRGHFLRFGLGADLVLVINAMLAGRYRVSEPAGRDPSELVFALALGPTAHGDPAVDLSYLDAKRMGKVYVARPSDEGKIPGYKDLGDDVLGATFTRERFTTLVRRRRDQVRNFLMDKTALASIGNAYADEILFAARVHPKTFCPALAPDDIARLHVATGDVLRAAIDEIQRRNPSIDTKLRDFLAVRGRDGEPCRVCGTTIRSVRVGAADSCFCPTCQPSTRKLFIDWGKARPDAGGKKTPSS